jgi:spore coat-associated protein N
MKKIIGLTIAAIIVIAIAGVGTFAFFSDTETSANNTITAGTLDLGLSNTTGTEAAGSATGTWVTPTGFKPGDNLAATLFAKNSGTVDMTTVTAQFAYTLSDGTPATVSPLGTANTDKIEKMVKATTVTWNGTAVSALQGKTLEELQALGAISLGSALTAGNEKALAITWTFDSTATNGCQGDAANITVTLVGTQN